VFSYSAQQQLSPFDNTDIGSGCALTGLQIEKGSQYAFAYNGSGELTEAQIPTGGYVRWDYGTYVFSKERKIREVAQRTLAVSREDASREDAGETYKIERDKKEKDAIIHGSATVIEPSGAQKVWTFCADVNSPYLGMGTSFEERDKNGQTVLRRTDYGWSQTTAGVPYKGSIAMALDPGTADEARKKTEIVRDILGNVNEVRQYDYNEATTPFKIIRNLRSFLEPVTEPSPAFCDC
jgi:YD repeat-containing protein